MFRRIAFILVCLGLALQGQAVGAVAVEQTPCPMEATMQSMLQAGELDPADLPNCCNDLETWAATGQLCKPGTDCGTAPAIWLAAVSTHTIDAVPSAVPRPAPAALGTAPLATPWRPPAAR